MAARTVKRLLPMIVLAGLVALTLTLLALEHRDVHRLRQQLATLRAENAQLQARLAASPPAAQQAATRRVSPAATTAADAEPPAPADPLLAALLAGDLATLHTLIESGADLTGRYAGGQTLLHLAAQGGNADVIALLAGAGLDVSAVDEEGRTPLHLAAEAGQVQAAQQLIELGANLEAVDAHGNTPLMSAVYAGNSALVDTLVAAGANTAVTGPFNQSLLHTAAYRGDTATVSALLTWGIEANALDARGRNALHYADADVVPLLVEAGLDVNQKDTDGNPPILNAMTGGEVERAGALYAAGADASVLLPQKDTFLLRSAQYGLTDLGGYLLDNGANVNAGADTGMTALDIAVKYDQEKMAALLIQRGGTRAQ